MIGSTGRYRPFQNAADDMDWHGLRVHIIMMAQALEEQDLPYELHIFQFGRHGISVATRLTKTDDEEMLQTSAGMWVPLGVRWMERLFGVKSIASWTDSPTTEHTGLRRRFTPISFYRNPVRNCSFSRTIFIKLR